MSASGSDHIDSARLWPWQRSEGRNKNNLFDISLASYFIVVNGEENMHRKMVAKASAVFECFVEMMRCCY